MLINPNKKTNYNASSNMPSWKIDKPRVGLFISTSLDLNFYTTDFIINAFVIIKKLGFN